jgi:hypothetical protein
MSYLMKFDYRDGVPTLELRGRKTAEAALDLWSSIHALIEKNKLEELLVIDEMVDELSVWDVVDIEASLTASGFPRGVRVAIVDLALRHERNSNAFSELYFLNRAWHRIKAFETQALALMWLGPEAQGNPASEAPEGP